MSADELFKLFGITLNAINENVQFIENLSACLRERMTLNNLHMRIPKE
jgi:hypothetical protein